MKRDGTRYLAYIEHENGGRRRHDRSRGLV